MGPKSVLRLLSAEPPRALAAHCSMSIRPREVWLMVMIRSARSSPVPSTWPNASSTMPSSKSVQFTGSTTDWTTTGPASVSSVRPSSCRAVAPEGFEFRRLWSRL